MSNRRQRALLAGLLIGAIALAFSYRHQLDVETLETWVARAGPAAPLLFVVLYGVATVLFLPGSVLTLAGGEGLIEKGLIALTLLAAAAFLPRLIGKLRERPMLEAEELKRRLDADEELLVMDVRTPDDFAGEQGHLKVARKVPLEDLADRLDELGEDPEQTIAIVCRSDRRSAKAAALLARRGFADVHVVRGGMTAWLAHGWPTELGTQQSESL